MSGLGLDRLDRRQFIKVTTASFLLPTISPVDNVAKFVRGEVEQAGPVPETEIFIRPMEVLGQVRDFVKTCGINTDEQTISWFERFADPNSREGQIISKAFVKLGQPIQSIYNEAKTVMAQTDPKTQAPLPGDVGVLEHLPFFRDYYEPILAVWEVLPGGGNRDTLTSCIFADERIVAGLSRMVNMLEPFVNYEEDEARAVYIQRAQNYIAKSGVLGNSESDMVGIVNKINKVFPKALVGVTGIVKEIPSLGENYPVLYGDGILVMPADPKGIDWVLALTEIARIGFPHTVVKDGSTYSIDTVRKMMQCYYPDDVLGLAKLGLERFKLIEKFLEDPSVGGEAFEPMVFDPDLYTKIGPSEVDGPESAKVYSKYCDKLVGVYDDLKATKAWSKSYLGLGWFFDPNGRKGKPVLGFGLRLDEKTKDSGAGIYNPDLVKFLSGGDKEIFGDKKELVKVEDLKYISAESIRKLGSLLVEVNNPHVVDTYGQDVVDGMNDTVLGMISVAKVALFTGWVKAMAVGEGLTPGVSQFLYYDVGDDFVATGMGFGNATLLRETMADEDVDLTKPMNQLFEDARKRGKVIREKIEATIKRNWGKTVYTPQTQAYIDGILTFGVLEQSLEERLWGVKSGEEDKALASLVAA